MMKDKRIKRREGRRSAEAVSAGEGVFYVCGLRVEAGNDGGNERSRERSRAARAIGRISEWRTPSYGRGERNTPQLRGTPLEKRGIETPVSNCSNHYFIDARERERMTA